MQKPTFKNNKHIRKQAFTLIELLIVIAIIGILFIVLISKVDFATNKAKITGVQTDFRSFQLAFETVSRENAGFNTFGWDTGDANANGKRDSYDEGDANKDGVRDAGEVWTGHKVPGETFTKVFTLVKPGTTFETNGYDSDAIAKLEAAINANLDPKLHITIGTDGKITMANGAQDPWNKEYHGEYITNAESDGLDRGAIVMYSDGANNEFGSEHSISNGVVSISIPGNNKYGKDDYGIAVIYSYVNGYGEIKTQTSGFSQNQEVTNNSNNSNNGSNGGNLNNVPVIGDTKQFATLITSSTLQDIYNLSTSSDKEEYNEAVILMNDEIYLSISIVDETTYSMYYELYNESEDWWYVYAYATQGIVDAGHVPEVGWYTFDDDSGEEIKCNAPSITFVQDLIIEMPNGLSDIAPLFVDHKHNYINCKCDCGDTNHNIQDGFCSNCRMGPGLYQSGKNYDKDALIYSWQELIDMGIIVNGSTYDSENRDYYNYDAVDVLSGDLLIYYEDGIIPDYAFYRCTNITGVKFMSGITNVGSYSFVSMSLNHFEMCEGITVIGNYAFEATNFNGSSITLPNSLTNIGRYAFSESCFAKLYMGSNIQEIQNAAFHRTVFDELYITSWDQWFEIEFGGSRFSNPMSNAVIVYVNGVLLHDIVIPEHITQLGQNQLHGCTAKGKLVFNSNLTFDNIGNMALHNLDVSEIQFNDTMTYIPDQAFDGCTFVKNIVFPKNITSIGKNIFSTSAYDNSLIEHITIHGDAYVDAEAFVSCLHLQSITFTSDLTKIRCGTCYSCLQNYDSCQNYGNLYINGSVDTSKFKVYIPSEYISKYEFKYRNLKDYMIAQ